MVLILAHNHSHNHNHKNNNNNNNPPFEFSLFFNRGQGTKKVLVHDRLGQEVLSSL